MASQTEKPIVLRIGEDIKYNHDFYNNDFLKRFTVVANEEPDRESFVKALKEKKYGNFSAIYRPHFQTGGEMGQWDDELIHLLPSSVRIFASAGAGFNWADTEALGRRGIWYSNGAGASDAAVSDTALWMIMSVFRNFWRCQRAARTCDPEQFTAMHKLAGSISWNPSGHVLGIIGLGNISKQLARKAGLALGMEIHYYDVVRSSPEVETELQATFHETLPGLLAVADCVSIHTPLNKHTQDLFNAETFAAMKDGSRLVNTARGEPLLWIMYFFNFLDRNAIANGRLNGMDVDLGLKDNEFQTLISILFVGYIAGQIPSNMILTKVRPSLYMAGFMAAWSIVTLFAYKARNFTDMLVLRFFLGVVEAPFYPGAVYVLSMLYTRKELASRMAIFYSGNIAASSFSGLVAAAIFEMDGLMGIEGWRWMFIVQGALSLAVSLPAFYLLPDSPLKTRWLSPEQRQLAHDRIVVATTNLGEEADVSIWKGLKQAAMDWRTWAFCLMANLHFTTNGFKNLLPTVIDTFGYGRVTTLGLTCPPYLLSGLVTILASWSSGRRNERCFHIIGCKVFTIIGFTICVSTLNIAARYVGIMIFVGATYGVNNLTLGWASSVMGETNQKRAIVIAICNTAGNLASVYSPFLWPDSDSPRYVTAMTSSIGFSLAVIGLALGVRFMLRRINRKMREENPDETNFYVT